MPKWNENENWKCKIWKIWNEWKFEYLFEILLKIEILMNMKFEIWNWLKFVAKIYFEIWWIWNLKIWCYLIEYL